MLYDHIFENTVLNEQKPSSLLVETFLWDDIMKANPTLEEMNCFLASDEAKALFETGYLTEANSVVVLSKLDDLSRRIKLAVLDLARKKKDTLWKKYAMAKAKEKELEDKMLKKYGSLGKREAIIAQKQIEKINPSYYKRRVAVSPLKSTSNKTSAVPTSNVQNRVPLAASATLI